MYTVETSTGIKTFLHMVKSAGISIHQGLIQRNALTHVNQRHAHIRNLPEKYSNFPKYMVIREPHSWYRSFYRFFLNVEGYMSFMLNDPKEPYDGYIYPISFDEFVKRSINLKDTLIRYPNKARVFRNLLRSQGNMHFITGYFDSDFHPDKPETMAQFDMSLYEWFWKATGGEQAINIPMSRLDIIEDIFEIKIPHLNKTSDDKPKVIISPETEELIRNNHTKFYDIISKFEEGKRK